ncbi:hypothetical protein NX059_006781 [Plenodomus lindquistii]|nr:hypothetical protein NX059_006781 [Plenodomus lindquistii]
MFSARIAISRHVGHGGILLRREVGGASGSIREIGGRSWIGSQKGSVTRQLRGRSTIASSPPPPPPDLAPLPNAPKSTPPPPPPRKSILIRLPIAVALTLLTFTTGFIMAGTPAISPIRALANPPTDAETLSLFQPPSESISEIERQIWTHPLTKSLLSDPKYTAARPHLKIPAELRPQNLTGGTLLGEDKIAVPPLQFTTEDGSSYVSIQYLGSALCGHPGIVHGGLQATLLDEGLARCCFPALPNKVGVTASLNIVYKAPVMAGQFVVLRAETTKVEGRKAWVKGHLETLVDAEKGEKAVVLTEGEALFIEPRQAAQMKRVVS